MTDDRRGTVRAALRAATRAAHARLDAHPTMLRLLAGESGIDRYGHLLRHYASLYAVLEDALDRAGERLPTGFDWPSRRKLPWLEDDLRVLGIDRPDGRSWAALSAIEHAAATIGMIYTIEGSTLGGRVIGDRLRRNLGIDETSGGRFFAGYGSETGARWRATCEAIESIADDEAAIAMAARRAGEVFDLFAVALDQAARD